MADDEVAKLKQKLIKNGMEQLVSVANENVVKILNKINRFKINDNESRDVLDIVKDILVIDIEVIDKSFKRLRNEAAVKYYKHFIYASRTENLSGQIDSQLTFLKCSYGQETIICILVKDLENVRDLIVKKTVGVMCISICEVKVTKK